MSPLFSDANAGKLTKQANAQVATMVRQLVDSVSPEYALEWAVSLPSQISVAVMSHAVHTWARQDAAAAAEFVSAFPEDEARQAAIAGIVEPIAFVDPERAWQWAVKLESPEERYKAISDVINDWGEVDRVAARAALAEAPISEVQRERIESRIRFNWREQ